MTMDQRGRRSIRRDFQIRFEFAEKDIQVNPPYDTA